ncbi:outer membrane beta-barrel protein [Pedobacter nototheniae]|uniref:outer membrane beta-barrel protein n=1 Tax=Pedobacter nototheniae TaxID=2488994 RepID=UPI00292EA95B|nr:outer membrane beta-barrel protein [Pedobacter nototheniae]
MALSKFFILKKSACVVLLILSSALLRAQNIHQIKGEVLDENKIPLPFVQAKLKRGADSVLIKTILSDNLGRFKFSVAPGEYIVQVLMMGYQPYTTNVQLSSESTIDMGKIQLIQQMQQLGTVNVTASVPFIERKADKLVVNLNGLGSGAPILDIMNQLPGVQVSPDDVLSLNGRPVQIYIDGKASTLSAEALAGLLKGISSSSIQKVELIAQPSAKYDAAGNGGIINLVRKKNYKAGLNGNVYGGAGAGKYLKTNGGVNLNYKGKNFNLLLNADYSFNKYFVNNFITSDFFSDERQFTGRTLSDIYSVRRNASYTPNLGLDVYLSKKTTLSASIRPGFADFKKDASSGTSNFDATGSLLNKSIFLNLVDTRSTNFSSGLHLQHDVDTSGRQLTADLDYYRFGNYSNQTNNTTLFNVGNNNSTTQPSLFYQDRVFSVYALKIDYSLPLPKGRLLEAGIKSSNVISTNSNRFLNVVQEAFVTDFSQNDTFAYRENVSALYGTYSFTGKKLSYQFGLRGEYTWGKGNGQMNNLDFNRAYFQLFPSFHADYKLSASNSLFFGLNKRIERPGYENLNPLIRIINSNNLQQGNPLLLPVKSYNLEMGYGYKNQLFLGGNYSLNVDDFTSVTVPYANDVISTMPGNADYSQYFAFYATYNKQILPWWTTSSNLTLWRRGFKGMLNGSLFENNGMFALNATSYNSFNITKNTSIMFLFNYRSKSVDRTLTNDAYAMLTAGIRQTFLAKKASLQLNFMDIFKSFKNSYQQNSGPIQQQWLNQYETRAIKINFSYSFGGAIKNTKRSQGAEEEKIRTNLKEN